jgi:TonB family protein
MVKPGNSRDANAPAYCTDADNRIVAMTGPLFVLTRSDFREQRGHEIPMEVSLSYEGRIALSAHVTELDPISNAPSAGGKTKATPSGQRVPSETVSGMMLKHIDPIYPKEAKKKHISGIVMIIALISKQGTITSLDVVASPDPLLTQSAKDAVQQWTYQPYLLDGVPVEIETTINVNYSFGSK